MRAGSTRRGKSNTDSQTQNKSLTLFVFYGPIGGGRLMKRNTLRKVPSNTSKAGNAQKGVKLSYWLLSFYPILSNLRDAFERVSNKSERVWILLSSRPVSQTPELRSVSPILSKIPFWTCSDTFERVQNGSVPFQILFPLVNKLHAPPNFLAPVKIAERVQTRPKYGKRVRKLLSYYKKN